MSINILRPFSAPKKQIYFDYASITPIDLMVVKAMNKAMKHYGANPSSLYAEGVRAKKFLDECRDGIAKKMEAHADEIIFTSGGTEANNLAIKGTIEKAQEKIKKGTMPIKVPHIIVSAIEHPSILEIMQWCTDRGCDVTILPVGENGIVDPKELKKALKKETILVSVMYINSEIGAIQPISDIAKVIRSFKKEKTAEYPELQNYPYFHTDACQAAQYNSLRIPALGVDMLTLDASKMYGPRGIGCLYVKRTIDVEPQQLGGSQESDRRAGTENLPSIAGFRQAFELITRDQTKEIERIKSLRDYLWTEIQQIRSDISINGDKDKRVPNNLNICIPNSDAEFLVLKLDVRGFALSSVTSCRNFSEDSSSYVIDAIGKPDCSKSSLRITLGRYTRMKDVKKLVSALKSVLK